MARGLRHRVMSVAGTVLLTACALALVNTPQFQALVLAVPVLDNLEAVTLGGDRFGLTVLTGTVAVVVAQWPVFKPRPRRILDTIEMTERRLFLGTLLLATVSYFDYTYKVPRPTLIGMAAVLAVALPAYQVAIRRRPRAQGRALIVGDDPLAMEAILGATDQPIIGCVSPPSRYDVEDGPITRATPATDGGHEQSLEELTNLGGLSRIDEVLVEYDVDTALLAFADTDRAEFFGTLDSCYRHGVSAMVHREHADTVLTTDGGGGELVEVDLEPWDWQDHVVKRAFDLGFSLAGLLVLSPLVLAIALGIKVDSPGPVLYSQERTAEFGRTVTVYKFRTMRVGGEQSSLERSEDERITRIGRLLRKTHLDEIPQLLTIMSGRMSVVGPRAAWTDEERHLEEVAENWRRRWFVKPGLTGLAQVNGVTSREPRQKLRYDIEYIRRQSFWFDLKFVVWQIWQVLAGFTAEE